jgi:hypothetical protein
MEAERKKAKAGDAPWPVPWGALVIAVRVRLQYEGLIENQRAEPYFCIESE